MITWILVATSADAKLFTSENLRTGELKLLREFIHTESRKKTSDLMTDRPGHYATGTGMHGSYSKNDPKEVEAEHFAIQLVHELKAGWDRNLYKHLVLVVPPHFYGLIKKHLGNHISDVAHISKDYTKYTLAQLADSLKKHLFG